MASDPASTSAAAATHAAHDSLPHRRDGFYFRAGLAVSALAHLLLFATIQFELRVEPRPVRVPLRSYRVDPAMQAYHIQPVTVPPGAPELPVPRRELPVTEVVPPALPVAAPLLAPEVPPAGAQPAPLTAAERLSRGWYDPMLLQPVGELPPPVLTESDILRLRLEALLGMYNDSLASAAAAAGRATDWTVKGKDGERWGISPGRIHLGKITLPLPFAFSAPPGRREEVAAKVRSWYETQSQASRIEAEETFESRARAIRERQQARRDTTRRGGGG